MLCRTTILARADEVLEFIDAVDAGVHASAFVDFNGKLYRALNPIFARTPLSGHGAQLHGGRFNAKATGAFYASVSIQTAIREANQAGSLQRITLVSYEAKIRSVFDSRDLAALAGYGMTASSLADNSWRDQRKARGDSLSQRFAARLVADRFNGLLVQSYAPGSSPGDLNLVLWKWGDESSSKLTGIDDEGRLAKRERQRQ